MSGTMTVSVQISSVVKSYDGNEVLRGCSFLFKPGSVHALMGPNGCGKSTLLRICALIEEPDSGEVAFLDHGATVQKDISLRRRITLVLPRVGVFNGSASWNVAYGLRLRGTQRGEMMRRADRALAMVGLSHKGSQNARTLSSGETQRIGLARALVIEPDVLFLDEPTAYVDQKSREIIEEIVRSMRGSARTVIVTTHDLSQAKRLADSLVVIEDGKLVSLEI